MKVFCCNKLIISHIVWEEWEETHPACFAFVKFTEQNNNVIKCNNSLKKVMHTE